MSGRVDGADRDLRSPDLLPVLDRVRDRRGSKPRHPERRRLVRTAVVERPVQSVEPHGGARGVDERLHHEDVIDVCVREKDALHAKPPAGDLLEDLLACDRRIDDDGVRGPGVREEIEIVVERAHGEPLHPHDQALHAVIAVMPNIGSPTMSTSLKPARSRLWQSSERVSAPALPEP